jgi:hypothetical protein
MNVVGIGTVAEHFLFWEYLLRIFGILYYLSSTCKSQQLL